MIILWVAIAALTVGFHFGHTISDLDWERDAYNRGHGEYFRDPNGKRRWRWK